MKFSRQLDKLETYFSQGETAEQKVGIEVEHFIVHQNSWRTVTYQEEAGIEDLLYQLQDKEWQLVEEGGHIIGLSSRQADITLEPGGQIEIGIQPCASIAELRRIYFSFLQDLIPLLTENNYYLVTLGYQPQSKITDISWNPKRRYKIMARYLDQKGKYAHQMMKGTAALQIALDYESEQDFIKKFRLANVLSPILAVLLDNAPIFEGQIYSQQALRTLIWNNTDPLRTGVVTEAFAADFGYREYAEYILTRELILLKTEGEYLATGSQTSREIFTTQQLTREKLEHILTMVFPDVRAKQFLEVRMIDSLPPKFIFAVIALWKGVFYQSEAFEQIYQFSQQFTVQQVLTAKQEIIKQGLTAKLGSNSILQAANKVVKIAKRGLSSAEKDYLQPIEQLINAEQTLAQQLKVKLQQQSLKQALKDCILNFQIKEGQLDESS